jgi:hypothetical protein
LQESIPDIHAILTSVMKNIGGPWTWLAVYKMPESIGPVTSSIDENNRQ